MRIKNWLFGVTIGALCALSVPAMAQQERCCSFQVRHNFRFCLSSGQIANGTWHWNLNAFVSNPPSTNTNAGSMNFTIPPTPFSQTQTVTNQLLGPNQQTCAISSAVAQIFIDQDPNTNCYTGYHEVLGRACAFCRGYSAGGWGSTSVVIGVQNVQGGQIGWQPIIQDRAAAGCETQMIDPVELKVRDSSGRIIDIPLFHLTTYGFTIRPNTQGSLEIIPDNDLDGDGTHDAGSLRIRLDGDIVGGVSGELILEYQAGRVSQAFATGDLSDIPLPNVGEPIRPIDTGYSEVPLRFQIPAGHELVAIQMGGGGQAGEIPRVEGDVNGDGCVDDSDLLAVLFAFGGQGGAEDINGDGIVDDADLLVVLFNFGSGC